jgi:uncharacterized membrane protein YcaP (DUF421 family)
MHTTTLLLPTMSLAEKLLRTLAVYFFLLSALRLAGKRELGQLNQFDLVVLLLLSNTVQNAIIGPDDTLTGGLIGAATLIAINTMVVRFLYSHPRLERLVEGQPDCLIKDGQILEGNLRKNTITREELEVAARKQGFDSLSDVETAHLEVGGALTFARKRSAENEDHHLEILKRLDNIASAQAQLTQRLDAMQPRPAS